MKISIPKLHSYKLKGMDNVVVLDSSVRENIDPKRVVIGAINEPLDKVIVCGILKDGEGYFASSVHEVSDVTHMLQRMLNALTR